MSHLALTGEINDEHGMASGLLAREIGYPGSSIAFAQLLSGMERSGLIRREVRGKRTYRITPAADPLRPAATRRPPPRRPSAVEPVRDFDYDELARRLLIQVLQQLTTSGTPNAPSVTLESDAMGRAVADLEQELASVRTMQGTLSAENARLREQLRAVQRSLELAERHPPTQPLGAAEMDMLESMLSPATDPTQTEDPH